MKNIRSIAVVIAVLVAAYFLLNSFIYDEKQEMAEAVPYRATLSGTYLCLPHTDTSGPQTMECAFGLLTDAGEYYAVDFNLMSQMIPNPPMGVRITASGVITPVEMLSTDMWRRYPIDGIFSVTDSFKTGSSSEDAE